MSVIIRILLEIWQLPQHIIAYVIMIVNRKSLEAMVNTSTDIKYYLVKHLFNSGISLGNYIFLDKDVNHNIDTIKHEHGHQIQSLILGPTYLIFIGLPSIIGNIVFRIKSVYFRKNFNSQDYYKLIWEAWADKLGKVNRNTNVNNVRI